MSQIADVRPSPIAGTWYSGDAARLRRQMLRFLDDAVLPALPGAVLGLIAPHAGHRYSGRTAGHAFAAVRGATPELVILVSPMHQPAPGTVLTTAHKAYATPLGEVPVDGEALEQLA
ncbi:MAG: AmmeMemoRadiSam system protein B, partial [Anaerolineae bacterium]|nr:AmmeMemoRadiSam system protein B [Anaerolineae bacterium]